MSSRSLIIGRWRTALEDGDLHFSSRGIDAVDALLCDFENSAAAADRQPDALLNILRSTVMELDAMGGEHGRFGTFIDTDEREELVPYLLSVVGDSGLNLDDGDPTAAYRPW